MEKLISSLFRVVLLILACIFTAFMMSCSQKVKKAATSPQSEVYQDVPFVQEFHDAYKISNNPSDNEVRSIAVDQESNIWIATASGVFRKKRIPDSGNQSLRVKTVVRHMPFP